MGRRHSEVPAHRGYLRSSPPTFYIHLASVSPFTSDISDPLDITLDFATMSTPTESLYTTGASAATTTVTASGGSTDDQSSWRVVGSAKARSQRASPSKGTASVSASAVGNNPIGTAAAAVSNPGFSSSNDNRGFRLQKLNETSWTSASFVQQAVQVSPATANAAASEGSSVTTEPKYVVPAVRGYNPQSRNYNLNNTGGRRNFAGGFYSASHHNPFTSAGAPAGGFGGAAGGGTSATTTAYRRGGNTTFTASAYPPPGLSPFIGGGDGGSRRAAPPGQQADSPTWGERDGAYSPEEKRRYKTALLKARQIALDELVLPRTWVVSRLDAIKDTVDERTGAVHTGVEYEFSVLRNQKYALVVTSGGDLSAAPASSLAVAGGEEVPDHDKIVILAPPLKQLTPTGSSPSASASAGGAGVDATVSSSGDSPADKYQSTATRYTFYRSRFYGQESFQKELQHAYYHMMNSLEGLYFPVAIYPQRRNKSIPMLFVGTPKPDRYEAVQTPWSIVSRTTSAATTSATSVVATAVQ